MAGGEQTDQRQKFAPIGLRVDALKMRLTVSALVGRVVALSKAGNEFVGLCPFHDERTPSFTINDAKGFYHCMGCGAHGDVIDFLIARHGFTFIEALRQLEADAGLSALNAEIRPADVKARERHEAKLLEEAEAKRRKAAGLWLYAAPGKDSPAQDYLEKARGIDFAALGIWPNALRYRSDVWHFQLGQKLPAMLACIIDGSGQHIATHATFLEFRTGKEGREVRAGDRIWRKLAPHLLSEDQWRVDRETGEIIPTYAKSKLIFGSFRGGYIPLVKGACKKPLHDIDAGLAVRNAEGIENALTCAMKDPATRQICSASGGNVGNVPVPPQAGAFIHACDNDAIGGGADMQLERCIAKQQTRAKEQAEAAGTEPRAVQLLWPSAAFKDFNDEHLGFRK